MKLMGLFMGFCMLFLACSGIYTRNIDFNYEEYKTNQKKWKDLSLQNYSYLYSDQNAGASIYVKNKKILYNPQEDAHLEQYLIDQIFLDIEKDYLKNMNQNVSSLNRELFELVQITVEYDKMYFYPKKITYVQKNTVGDTFQLIKEVKNFKTHFDESYEFQSCSYFFTESPGECPEWVSEQTKISILDSQKVIFFNTKGIGDKKDEAREKSEDLKSFLKESLGIVLIKQLNIIGIINQQNLIKIQFHKFVDKLNLKKDQSKKAGVWYRLFCQPNYDPVKKVFSGWGQNKYLYYQRFAFDYQKYIQIRNDFIQTHSELFENQPQEILNKLRAIDD